ncbi:ketosteroid isomerase-like protein [Elusimicrobium posterum]|uniref:nuclear transport factor 2 family protein n=1 Tax=Elusimicrobium posterum TaxID=3116653 RepID=UPI003C73BECD
MENQYKKGTEPFFKIVMEGLRGEVDGNYFWDTVAENAVFEFMYNFPGFTNKFQGRKAYMDWFKSYSNELHSADNLRVYKAEGGVIILEYEVHGIVPSTGKVYNNRFCSIVTIRNRKIVYWRDYMDSLAVMLAAS